MPIPVVCPGCGFTASVPEAFAGRSAKCKRCGARITVPSAVTSCPSPSTLPWPMSDTEADVAAVAVAIPELDPSTMDFPTVEVDEEGAAVEYRADEVRSKSRWPTRYVEGREPWFYPFLEREAGGWKAMATLSLWANLAVFPLVCASLAASFGREFPAFTLAICAGVGLVVGLEAFMIWRMLMLISAWINLSVDHARNDRQSRIIMESRPGIQA